MPTNAVKISNPFSSKVEGEQHFRTREKQKASEKKQAKEASFGNQKSNELVEKKQFENPKERYAD